MRNGPPVAGTLGGAESSLDQKQSAAGAVNRESVRTGPKARRAKRGPLDSAAALCSQYRRCPAAAPEERRRGPDHGVVVDSVNVRVLLYAPVRSASLAPIACENVIVTESLDTGALYVSRGVGAEEPPTLASAPPVPAALVAFACRADGSENDPFTRWPVAVEDGSATESVASPADEMTVAEEVAVYVFATPGVNAPKAAGVPSASDSVAGTE